MKVFRLLHAFLLILSCALPSFAEDLKDDPIYREAIRDMGPNSSIDVKTTDRDGIVTRTYQVRKCQADGQTCGSYSRGIVLYRHTQVQSTVEGKTLFVQTVDQAPAPATGPPGLSAEAQAQQQKELELFERLSFQAATLSESSEKDKDGNPLWKLPKPLKIEKQDPFFKELQTVAPAIAIGLANGLEDMKAAEQTAHRLQQAYQQAQERMSRANDHHVDSANKQKEAASISAGYTTSVAAEMMGRPVQSTNQSSEYLDYLKAAKDPFSFKDYELTPLAKARLTKTALDAISKRKPRAALQVAKILLHQQNPANRESAANTLHAGFKDGVLRTQVFTGGSPSVLDQARFQTAGHSEGGSIIREVANKAQLAWVDSGSLQSLSEPQVAAYTSALVALRSSDESFAAGKNSDGLYMASVADTLLDFSRGFYRGGLKGLTEAAEAIPVVAKALGNFGHLLMTEPAQAQKQFGQFVEAVPGIAEAVALHYLYIGDQIVNGSPVQKGEAMGQLGSDVLLTYITGGTASAAKSGVKGAATIIKSSRVTEAAASAAKQGFTRAAEMTQQFSRAQAKTVVELATTQAQAAVNVVKATTNLTKQSSAAAREYLNHVLVRSKTGIVAGEKATQAMTSAVNAGVIRSPEQITVAKKFLAAIESMPHQIDFRQVGSFEKVALIGRDMFGNVHKIRDELMKKGIVVEIFETSTAANQNWKALIEKYGEACKVPLKEVVKSVGYIEDKNWTKEIVEKGYTILDANNPKNLPPSLYYQMECKVISRGQR